jgi:hypothetical protein
MSRIIVFLASLMLVSCTTGGHKTAASVVLPDPSLLRCGAGAHSRLWKDSAIAKDAIFPKQLTVDLENECIPALTAVYDKGVPTSEIRSAIDANYGKWAFSATSAAPSNLWLWRIEPEKFAISLTVDDDGTKKIHYLAFQKNAKVFKDWTDALTGGPK